MKKLLLVVLCVYSGSLFSQKDSLDVGDSYWEDQLYLGVTFNELMKQPSGALGNGFSYGLNTGYIKDISLVKSGKLAIGIGLGYAYDALRHGFKLSRQNNSMVIDVDAGSQSSGNLRMHSLEIPLEFRWRTSASNKYKFWRVYAGVKMNYNLKNSMSYSENATYSIHTNLSRFNKFQFGLTLAAGYASFNFKVDYGLTPILKDADIGTVSIRSRILRFGMIFYIL